MARESFLKFEFSRIRSVASRMGLGDHLVTIRVLEHPWGPMQWPLGLFSPCDGPSESPKITSQLLLRRLFSDT